MSDVRLVELETRQAFQEQTLQELNEVITRQQQQLDQLRNQLVELAERLAAMDQPAIRPAGEEPPPPHY
jgi:SlyX protein